MNKNKHLTFDNRLDIEKGLKNNLSFKQIGKSIEKDSTTISKEVRNHIVYKNTGSHGRPFNDCIHRKQCEFRSIGEKCNINNCEHYIKESCLNLSNPPYVCNGCCQMHMCTLSKQFYNSIYAQKEYEDTLRESRQGITYTEEEIQRINDILKPLIVDQNQSVYHALSINKDTIMCSEKEIYNLIDSGVFPDIRNINLPRKVKYRKRAKRKTYYKIDKKCLEGRRYSDYEEYIANNPDINIVEMDSVEGKKGGKVLLTLHFVNCNFMLAFLREHNDSQSVINIFNMLEETLGIETFKKMFPVILTDNGSEFSNPTKIEFSQFTGEKRTQIYYCEPGRSDQKGSCEVNHELIRRVLPKGTDFKDLQQEDINLLMSHIDSYKRKKLNNLSPTELFNLIYGNDIAKKLGIIYIKPDKINLSKSLLKKKD